MNLKNLQNGSDIRGISLDGIQGEEVNFTPEIAGKFAKAFLVWLGKKLSQSPEILKISIGTDSRLSGKQIKNACIEAINDGGAAVMDFGMASTPAMFMSTVTEGYLCDGAIMLTASHLPFNRNGMKFFTKNGGLEKEDISAIIKIAEENNLPSATQKGICAEMDFIKKYAEILVENIRKNTQENEPLKGMKIIVDAGNGSGGFFVDQVLIPLGADTRGSQFLEPDGNFPNHVPNPEDHTAMKSICEAVLNNKADLGIIFDTDVDRSAVVDHQGKEINRNRLIALISSIILEEHPKSWIVTDSITSDGLTHFIQEVLGGIHHRFKRGYKNVINESQRLNSEGKESWLAIETSGHAALKENFFLDDGAYLIAKTLIKLAQCKKDGKKISQLIDLLPEPAESAEIRMNIKEKDFKAYGNQIILELEDYSKSKQGWTIAPNNFEGIRVSCDKKNGDGWFLLRLSLHDPVIPLNIESNSVGGLAVIQKELYNFLKQFDLLDLKEFGSV